MCLFVRDPWSFSYIVLKEKIPPTNSTMKIYFYTDCKVVKYCAMSTLFKYYCCPGSQFSPQLTYSGVKKTYRSEKKWNFYRNSMLQSSKDEIRPAF